MRFFVVIITVLFITVVQAQPELVQDDCIFSSPNNIDAMCGFVRVPENPSMPDGQMIDIAFARFTTSSSQSTLPPLIYLHGGPGGQIVVYGDLYANALAPLWQGRDLIIFDQRGVGLSRPRLDCAPYFEAIYQLIQTDSSEDNWYIQIGNALKQCKDTYLEQNIDLTQYTTAQSAHDVIAILDALGYEQAHLLGISYGTRLALTVAQQAPQRIERMILDSVVAPAVDGEAEFASNFYDAFNKFFATCDGDMTCKASYPDLASRFYAIVEAHNQRPYSYEVFDVNQGQRLNLMITGDLLMEVLFNQLYDSRGYPSLPLQIVRLENGNYDYFAGTFLQDIASINDDISIGMYYAIMCQDEINFTDPSYASALNQDLPEALLSFSGDTTNNIALCAGYAQQQQLGANDKIQSDVPTLIFNGEFDPVTPPHWAEAVHEDLPNSQLFIFSTSGHAVLFSDTCALALASQFIAATSGEPINANCIIEDYDFYP